MSECIICFENLEENYTITTCKHEFHTHCIEQWLEFKTTCPICRTVLREQKQPSFVLHPEDNGYIYTYPMYSFALVYL